MLSALVVAVLAAGAAVTVGTPARADTVAVDGPTTGGLKDFESAPTPVISGTVAVGQELTVEPGVWTPDTSFGYQWLADGVAVPGATGPTLVLGPDHVDKAITAQVTGSKLGYATTTMTSAPTAKVSRAPMVTAVPTVTGTARIGEFLTAVPGAWGPAPVTLTYLWYSDGQSMRGLPGATSAVYRVRSADLGRALSVRVAGSKAGYDTVSRDSAATAAVTLGKFVGVVPIVTGIAKVEQTLTAKPGTWSPTPDTLKYQWYRSGVAITGATAPTYKLSQADTGKKMTVRTTGSRQGSYIELSMTSAPTAAVATNLLTAPRPLVTGTAKVGQTLTVRVGAWTPVVYLRTYQWKRNGLPILGATDTTYKITAKDVGKALSIAVTGRKGGFLTKTVTSYRTSVVIK